MKRTMKAISWTFACLLVTAGAMAQDPAAAAPAEIKAGPPEQVAPAADAAAQASTPALAFDSLSVDFGTAEEGKMVEMEFPFKNTSDKTITVTSVKASCGCTAPELQKKVFAPGEGDVIRATFNSKGRTGSQTKTVTVTTDEPNGTYQLRFHGEVVSQVYIEPKLLNFGEVMQGTEKAMTFELIDFTGQNIEIKGLTSAASALKTEHGAAVDFTDESGRKGRKIPITVTVTPEIPVGNLATTLAIETSYTERPSFVGSIRGVVRGEVSVQPAQVYFGFVAPGETASRKVGVTVLENKKFEMTSFEIKPDTSRSVGEAPLPKLEVVADAVADDVPASPERSYTVTITVPEKTGRYAGEILLQGTVDGQAKSVGIPYNAFVRTAPGAAATNAVPATNDGSAASSAATRERVQAILKQNEDQQKARWDALKQGQAAGESAKAIESPSAPKAGMPTTEDAAQDPAAPAATN